MAGGCRPGVPGFLRCSDSPRGCAAAELRPKETWDLLHAVDMGFSPGGLRAFGGRLSPGGPRCSSVLRQSSRLRRCGTAPEGNLGPLRADLYGIPTWELKGVAGVWRAVVARGFQVFFGAQTVLAASPLRNCARRKPGAFCMLRRCGTAPEGNLGPFACCRYGILAWELKGFAGGPFRVGCHVGIMGGTR